MPRRTPRQTKILDHFAQPATRTTRSTNPTTTDDSRPGPSQARRESPIHRYHSDSEGEEGISNIPLNPLQHEPSQIRVISGMVLDSDDEGELEGEDDDEEEEEYVSPAKRRRKKEVLKRPERHPGGKETMSMPAWREEDYYENEDDDEDEDDEDYEQTARKRMTRREKRRGRSVSTQDMIEVIDTDDEEETLGRKAGGRKNVESKDRENAVSLAPTRTTRSTRSTATREAAPRPATRSRQAPVIEMPASSGPSRPRRGQANDKQDSQEPTSSEAINLSVPTQSTSRSIRSQGRLRPVVELRSWSQEELQPYSVHTSPAPDVTSDDSRRGVNAPRTRQVEEEAIVPPPNRTRGSSLKESAIATRMAPIKTYGKAGTRSRLSTRRADPIQIDDDDDYDEQPVKHTNEQDHDDDDPIPIDEDDIPLSLPVPGSARSQRTAKGRRKSLTVDTASDSSAPVLKRSGKARTAVKGRVEAASPADTLPSLSAMFASDEEREKVTPRAGSRRQGGSSSARKKARIQHDPDSESEDELYASEESAAAPRSSRKQAQSTYGGPANSAKPSHGKESASKPGRGKTSRQVIESDESSEDQSDPDDLAMDQMQRFATQTRLRKQKETPFQRNLRKAKAKRLGIVESTTEESEEEELGEPAILSAVDGSPVDDDEFYITDDDDDEERARQQMPAQFRLDSAQTPEYKFKVVLHYFVYLVVHGAKALPLRGKNADYFLPMLRDIRRLLQGYRDSRVRSQIWRREFVDVLEKYPEYKVTLMDIGHSGCDACHISMRYSKYQVRLEGDPYDRETHEPLEVDSEEEREKEKKKKAKAKRKARRVRDGSDPSSSESEDGEARLFHMGKYCCARAKVYHAMSHWEDTLYYRVRAYWKLLRRAHKKDVPSDSEASSSEDDSDESASERQSRRLDRHVRRQTTKKAIEAMKLRGDVPKWNDVDAITQSMDDRGEQAKELRWFNELIRSSEDLEYSKNRTDD